MPRSRRKRQSEENIERLTSGVQQLAGDMRSRIRDLDISGDTIPDAFRNVPKFISPATHAWLDAGVTAYFLALSGVCAIRGKRGPALAALINGGMVAGVSLLTDYEGTREKPINFKLHGTLDAVQALTAAAGPILHGFAGEPEAAFFYGQAANEVAVIAGTDWDAGMPRSRSRRRAA